MNSDRDLRGAGCPSRIGHCVSKHIQDRLAIGPESLHRGIAIVNGVRVRTIGCDVDRTIGTGNARGNVTNGTSGRSRHHTADSLGLAIGRGVWIGIVGENVAGWVGTGSAVAHSACFNGDRRIRHGRWGIIGP